jgi:hypothetical protein
VQSLQSVLSYYGRNIMDRLIGNPVTVTQNISSSGEVL